MIDGYHFYKELRKASKDYPGRRFRVVIENAIRENDKKKADIFLRGLSEEGGNALGTGTYLFGHWEEIRRLMTLDIPGS